jgi:hypothetical protein
MGERVPIEMAAARLGLSAEAIRKRLHRGTLSGENARLWTELETRAEELRRKDHIIAGLVQRIPELSASSDAQEASQVDENPPHDAQDLGYVYRPPEPSRRHWWKLWRRS